jgi:hypothetical protein
LLRDVENLWIFCTKPTANIWNSLKWTRVQSRSFAS